MDLKERAASFTSVDSMDTDEDTASRKSSDDDSDLEHFTSLDATENHGKFLTHDDEFIAPHTKKVPTLVPVMLTAQREAEDDDGHIYGEFTGHESAVSEVYEDYTESYFTDEEMAYEQEYADTTYDNSALY